MTAPHVEQTRRAATLVSGATVYEVTTTVTDKGDLPTRNLFVLKINDPENPRADVLARIATPLDVRRLTSGLHVRVDSGSLTYLSADPFARIASLSDLTTIDQDRTTAVRAGRTEYLVASVAVTYTDSTTADAGYRQILARLSALTVAWHAFVTSFETAPSQGYDLPVADVSVEDARRLAYASTVTARRATEAALDAAQAAYDTCQTDCGADRAIHTILVRDVATLERARSRVSALTETASTNVKDFVLQQASFASDVDSYEAFLGAKRTALDTYAARVQACQDRCAQLRVERDAAQAAVARALDAERQSLASLRAVCPTFVPSE
jgi:hypothetical protein